MEIQLSSGCKVDIEPGDFINLTIWFGDVWAEVKTTYRIDENSAASVTFYCHRRGSKHDTDRCYEYHKASVGSMRFYQYRKVCKGTPPPDAKIVHAATYYMDKDMPIRNHWLANRSKEEE